MMPSMSLQTSSTATSGADNAGYVGNPWYQGDFVVSSAGAATSGDRTAPSGGGISPTHIAIGAAVLLVGFLLWRRFK
jgi:hypothetical protein